MYAPPRPANPYGQPHPARLPRYLAVAYIVLVVYASLYPLTGWKESSAPLLEFLNNPWPRYFTATDLLFNLLAYMPLGLLLVPALHPVRAWLAIPLTLLLGTGLSLGMEVAQNFLPTRVPSNVDLALNAAGTLLGAVAGLQLKGALLEGGYFHALRVRMLFPGAQTDYGLVLLALWLLTQLSPEALLFGTGDLHPILGLERDYVEDLEAFVSLEATIACCGVVVAGLIVGNLLRDWRATAVLLFFSAALLVKSLGAAILIDASEFAHWLTPGNAVGLCCGLAILAALSRLPRNGQRSAAGTALMLATALTNLAPENPYLTANLHEWTQGHFLNFNGFTRLITSIWPFLATPYVLSLNTWQKHR